MPTSIEQLGLLAAHALPHYLKRPGKGNPILEAARKHVLFGRLFKKARTDVSGGTGIRWPVHFNKSNVVQPYGPYSRMNPGTVQPARFAAIPWRAAAWSVFVDEFEIDLNKGEKEVLVDTLKLVGSVVGMNIVEFFETVGLAEDGNYQHDGQYSLNDLFLGLKYWCTIDGLHITGDTTKTVGGLNPNDLQLWRNGYINPVTASDGVGPITSMMQMRECLDRAFMDLTWDEFDYFGEMTGKVQGAPTRDWDSGTSPKDLMIWTSKAGSIEMRQILFDREDNVGRDQHRPRPVYHGVTIHHSDLLGISQYGYGIDRNNNAMWTSRGGSYANGNWPNHHEFMLIDTNYFKVAMHPQHAPGVKKPYVPESRFGLTMEGNWWLQTMCESRQRGLYYIGPVPRGLN